MRAIVTTTIVLLLAATATMGFVAPTAPTIDGSDVGSDTQVVGELARGDALFWDGPYLDSVGTGTRASDAVLCESAVSTYLGCAFGWGLVQPTAIAADFTTVVLEEENPFCGDEHACFTYAFDVTEPGDVLRVAIDQQSLRDLMFVYLYDPSGRFVAKLFSSNAERWIDEPAEGRWIARVEVFDARDTSFRMRAALDPDDRPRVRGPERGVRQRSEFLLPNLQMVPPFELGFGPCQATEIVDYGAQRCLRFSTGPGNAGDGPLDLVVPDTGSLEGQMHQRLHRPDGTTELAAAGSYVYHPEHAHYHHDTIASLELLRVTDARRGSLEPAGEGPKLGFCLAPYFVAEWHSFAQDPPYGVYEEAACSGVVDPPVPAQMALARGWVDVYGWFVEGNFVDFGDNPDGLYVIRVATDPDGHIRETRDDDNHAYTYIRVAGDDIEVIERGIGDSPWDRQKTVVNDTRPPIRWSEENSP